MRSKAIGPVALLALVALVVSLTAYSHAVAQEEGYRLLRGVADQSAVSVADSPVYRLAFSIGQPFAGQAGRRTDTWLGAEYWYAPGSQVCLPLLRR